MIKQSQTKVMSSDPLLQFVFESARLKEVPHAIAHTGRFTVMS